MRITRDDFERWREDPVTREFMKMLDEDLDKLRTGTMNEFFVRDQIANAIEFGKHEAIEKMFNLRYEELVNE